MCNLQIAQTAVTNNKNNFTFFDNFFGKILNCDFIYAIMLFVERKFSVKIVKQTKVFKQTKVNFKIIAFSI